MGLLACSFVAPSEYLRVGPVEWRPRSTPTERLMQPLSGIRVLDFSTLLPGPMATLLLAEAGAEVIKIERPDSGEELRTYRPRFADTSVSFAMLNRGKAQHRHRSQGARRAVTVAPAARGHGRGGRAVSTRRHGPSRIRIRSAVGDQPAHRLLRHYWLRTERPQGAGGCPRSQLSGGRGAAVDRSGRRWFSRRSERALRRHRRGRLSRGDQYLARPAQPGAYGQGLQAGHRDDRRLASISLLGHRQWSRHGKLAQTRRRAAVRRQPALSDLSHGRRQTSRRGAVGGSVLGQLLRCHRAAGRAARRSQGSASDARPRWQRSFCGATPSSGSRASRGRTCAAM